MGGQFLLIHYGMAQADDCMEQNLPSLIAIWASRFPKRGSITLAAKVITCFLAFLSRTLVVTH